jgi:hypothetical protein
MMQVIYFAWNLTATLLFMILMMPATLLGWIIGVVVRSVKDGYHQGFKAGS